METRIQDYCKLGIVHFMLYKFAGSGEGNIAEAVNAVCENKELDAIEVTWVKDKKQREETASILKSSGKAVGFGAHPIILGQGLNLNAEDETVRQKAVNEMKALVDQAYELGSSGFVVLSGKDPGEEKRSFEMNQLVKSLLEIDEELKRCGDMSLILEVFDRVDYGKNCLIGPHKDSVIIADEMRKKAPDFGILADLSHIPLLFEGPTDAVQTVKDCLVHAHLGNCVMDDPEHEMYGDKHPPIGDPAGVNGVKEVTEYLQALLDIGFLDREKRPVMSFEVCPYENWTPDDLLRQSLDVTYEAFKQVK